MYIDDCLFGTECILNSDIIEPLNLGSSELVSINQLVDIVEAIAGVKLRRHYNLSAPKGVNGRNSDNTRIKQLLDREPSMRLRDGLEKTCAWIRDQGCNGSARQVGAGICLRLREVFWGGDLESDWPAIVAGKILFRTN